MKTLFKKVQQHVEIKNEKYGLQENKGQKRVVIELED